MQLLCRYGNGNAAGLCDATPAANALVATSVMPDQVVQFYKAMGGLLGSKLEQMGSSMGGSMQQAATKQAACSRPYLP